MGNRLEGVCIFKPNNFYYFNVAQIAQQIHTSIRRTSRYEHFEWNSWLVSNFEGILPVKTFVCKHTQFTDTRAFLPLFPFGTRFFLVAPPPPQWQKQHISVTSGLSNVTFSCVWTGKRHFLIASATAPMAKATHLFISGWSVVSITKLVLSAVSTCGLPSA